MPVLELPNALWILLGVQTGLLALLVLGQILQGVRLRRLERLVRSSGGGAGTDPQRANPGDRESGRLFEMWLDEDPSRREWPKKEQFAGFRKWRAERGMTWRPEGR